LRLLRVIAYYKLVTPVEAEGEFCFTLRNVGTAEVGVVQFPRFSGFYFQRLEVFDSDGKALEILKEDDPECREGAICVVLREPLKPDEQATLRFRYALVPEKELKGFFIKRAVLKLPLNLDEGTSAYVHVLPPEGMRLELENDFFTPFTPLIHPETAKGYPIATPEEGSRYISMRFPRSRGAPVPGTYMVLVSVKYPPSLSWTIILLPFAAILLFLGALARRMFCPHLPPLPPSLHLALFGALLGVRIWSFNELLMKRLSYFYVAGTILSLVGAVLASM